MIKVLLVDDQPCVRKGLRMCLALEPGVAVVGEAGDGREALRLVRELEPDVVVMDARMPGMDGFTAAQRVHELAPQVAVIIHSLYDDAEARERARRAGAAAFVTKRGTTELLLGEIYTCCRP